MKRDEAAAAKSRYPPAPQPRIKEKERERKRESNLTTPDGYTYVLRLAFPLHASCHICYWTDCVM